MSWDSARVLKWVVFKEHGVGLVFCVNHTPLQRMSVRRIYVCMLFVCSVFVCLVFVCLFVCVTNPKSHKPRLSFNESEKMLFVVVVCLFGFSLFVCVHRKPQKPQTPRKNCLNPQSEIPFTVMVMSLLKCIPSLLMTENMLFVVVVCLFGFCLFVCFHKLPAKTV